MNLRLEEAGDDRPPEASSLLYTSVLRSEAKAKG